MVDDSCPRSVDAPADGPPEPPSYPEWASEDEQRRAWIVAQLCGTAEGPIFDSITQHAAAIDAFLRTGNAADQPARKPRPQVVK